MLNIDKNSVDYLVTDTMVQEVENLLEHPYVKENELINEMVSRKIERIYFVACGSPLCAAQTSAMVAQKYSALTCLAYSGWDFLDQPPFVLDSKTLVIGISHYGKTEEVAQSVKLARSKGAMTLGITRDKSGSLLSEEAEFILDYRGESIWEMHLVSGYSIVGRYIQRISYHKEVESILNDLPKLPAVLKRLVDSEEAKAKELGIFASKYPFIYTVASGNCNPLAYKEGIITMLEFTWTHGCVLNAAEFRHGPLEVVEEGVPYVFLLGNDESRHTAQRALNFVKKLTSDVIVFDVNDLSTDLHPMLTPMTLFVPLEYFYYYLSIAKDHNPDDRRYYGGLMEY